jgi:uncharacterized protein
MIVDLRKIPAGPQDFAFTMDEKWWRSERPNDQVLGLSSPMEVKINLYWAGDKIVLNGELDGSIEVQCDRCLESFHRELKTRFRAFLALPPPDAENADIELIDEAMEVDFIRGEEIDLDDIIREQIYLALPMKCLCDKDCSGLCPECGGNLNRGECKCSRESVHPAFAKLKNLKIKGDNR